MNWFPPYFSLIISIELIDKRLIQLIRIFFMIFFLEIIFNLVIFNSKTFLSNPSRWLLTALLFYYWVLIFKHYTLHFVELKDFVLGLIEINWLLLGGCFQEMGWGIFFVEVLWCFAHNNGILAGFIFCGIIDTYYWHGLIMLQRPQPVLFWCKVPLLSFPWH